MNDFSVFSPEFKEPIRENLRQGTFVGISFYQAFYECYLLTKESDLDIFIDKLNSGRLSRRKEFDVCLDVNLVSKDYNVYDALHVVLNGQNNNWAYAIKDHDDKLYRVRHFPETVNDLRDINDLRFIFLEDPRFNGKDPDYVGIFPKE